MRTLFVILLCLFCAAAMAEPPGSFGTKSKLRFHAESWYSPWTLAGSVASAGVLQGTGAPDEWGRSYGAYGKRFASAAGSSAVRATLAFGLGSALHQDPRYYRSRARGAWRRTVHALRGTILTRTDRGGETLSTWRLGSAYGTAYLSNQWYPDRLHTVHRVALGGTFRLGFDFAGNLASEFGPDLKRRFRRR